MIRKILCLVSVLALVTCAVVLPEKYNGTDSIDYGAGAETVARAPRALYEDAQFDDAFSDSGRESASKWKKNWELALAAENEAEASLRRGDALEDDDDTFAGGFGDFVWGDDLNGFFDQDIEDI